MVESNNLYGIAYGCPCIQRKDNCPLKEVEYLSFSEKVIWINGLSNEKIKTILEHHKACSKNRE